MRVQKGLTLAEVGELGFLARLLPSLPVGAGVKVGAGDDCAVIVAGRGPRLLMTTDAVVEGVHFRRSWMTARQIGRKAYLINASDIAAMGGRPRFCTVSVGAPARFPRRDLTAMHRGIADAARETGASVVGGNLSRAPALFVSITLVGECPPRPLLRGGGRAGDLIYVTGTLGDAALGLRLLRANPAARSAPVRRFREPAPRLRAGAWLAGARGVTAAIDVSDGLLRDLDHLCVAGGVGATVHVDRLPCTPRVRRQGSELALNGGEDYELLCTVSPSAVCRLDRFQRETGCRLTRIGEIEPQRRGIRVLSAQGRSIAVQGKGFDHFKRTGRG